MVSDRTPVVPEKRARTAVAGKNSSGSLDANTEKPDTQKEKTWWGLPIFRIESPDDLAKALVRRESHFMFLVTSLVVLVTALTGFTVWDSAKRSEQSSERAESYVREITGAARPRMVIDINGVSALDLDGVGVIGSVSPEFFDAPVTPFFIEIVSSFKGTISGGPGKLVGIEVKLDGEILEAAASDFYGNRIESRFNHLKNLGQYSSQGDMGVPIGYDENFSFIYRIRSYFKNCDLAVAEFNKIVSKETPSVIAVRPVFERIEVEPGFKEFTVTSAELDGLSCIDWEYVHSRNNEAEIDEKQESVGGPDEGRR